MAFLRTISGLQSGCVRELKPGNLVFGRNPKRCDVVLDHFAVSREHARLEVVEGVAYIEDLRSRNGVLVNGKMLKPGPSGRRRLLSGDHVQIATYEFIYEEDPSGAVEISDEPGEQQPAIISTVAIRGNTSTLIGDREDSRKLRTVLNITEQLSSGLEMEKLLPRVMASLFESFEQARSGVVLLRDQPTAEFVPAVVHSRNSESGPVRVSRTVVQQVVETCDAVLIHDAQSDGRFDAQSSIHDLGLRSLICAPLIDSRGTVIGILQLESEIEQRSFTPGDLEILAAVARHLATVIENVRLHETALKSQRLELEQRFRRVIEGSIQGIVIHRHLCPLFVNDAWAALHGYTAEEVLNMPSVAPLIEPDSREKAMSTANVDELNELTPVRYEVRGHRRDGSSMWLEKFITVVDWEGGLAVQTAVVDITERRLMDEQLRSARDHLEQKISQRTAELEQANEQLTDEIEQRNEQQRRRRDSESLYASLVEHIPLCVARKDPEGRLTFVNQTMARLFDCWPDDLIGKTDFDLFPAEDAEEYRRDDEQVMASGELLDKYDSMVIPGIGRRDIHMIKKAITYADQRSIGTQEVFWDVTEQKRLEAERNQYAEELERRNRDLEQLAYSVSHDLQSPLRTVTSYCQLLQQRYQDKLDSEADEFLNGAIDGARRMKRLLDDLLAYSRVTTQADRFRLTSSHDVVLEALDNLQAAIDESGADVQIGSLPEVMSDPTQLMLLFQNLIGNAIRYRSEQPPEIRIEATDQGSEWEFEVSDNGVGIPPKFHTRIFQIFKRLYAEHEIPGSGVGLAICKRIVERHGGRIWVESSPGEGSTFRFRLPKNPIDQPGASAADESA